LSSFGRQLRLLRQRRGFSLAELAERAEVARSYLSMMENDKVDQPPSKRIVARLEAALDAPAESLARLADWQRTPETIRSALRRSVEQAGRGARRPDGSLDLDRLLLEGPLASELAKLVHEPEPTSDQAPENPRPDAGEPNFETPTAGGVSAGLPPPGTPGRVPLINLVPAGTPGGFTDLDYPARVADQYLPRPPGLTDPDAFAARVTGESMSPDYRPGDLVFFSPLADTPDGADCFVRLEDEHDVTFKRVRFFEQPEGVAWIELKPLNPAFATRRVPRDAVALLARAVWSMRPLTGDCPGPGPGDEPDGR